MDCSKVLRHFDGPIDWDAPDRGARRNGGGVAVKKRARKPKASVPTKAASARPCAVIMKRPLKEAFEVGKVAPRMPSMWLTSATTNNVGPMADIIVHRTKLTASGEPFALLLNAIESGPNS